MKPHHDTPSDTAAPIFRFRDSVSIRRSEAEADADAALAGSDVKGAPPRRRSLVARASDQEWAVPALLVLLDVTAWFAIYGFTSLLRGDAYYSSPFVCCHRYAAGDGDRPDSVYHWWL